MRRGAAGLGRELLEWAAAAVSEQGRELLRLDCGATNHALRGYYETAGFVHRGDVEIPVGAVKWSSGRPVVSRYERPVP